MVSGHHYGLIDELYVLSLPVGLEVVLHHVREGLSIGDSGAPVRIFQHPFQGFCPPVVALQLGGRVSTPHVATFTKCHAFLASEGEQFNILRVFVHII